MIGEIIIKATISSNARDTKLLLNQASLDMDYNFGTETESGSNNETNLSVSNTCETMCAALSFRVGLPLSPLRLL